MAKFKYTAVSTKGGSLNGVIEADSLKSAREQLNSLKLSVVSLDELELEEEGNSNLQKFKFEGTDPQNKKVLGTIQSSDLESAFIRLTSEYELSIHKLADFNATTLEFEGSKNQVQQFYLKNASKQNINFSENHLHSESSSETTTTSTSDNSKNTEIPSEFLQLIEQTIFLFQDIYSKYKDNVSDQVQEFLQKYQEHLNKIKFSDNISNTATTAIKALEYIKETELFIPLIKNPYEQYQKYLEVQELIEELNLYNKNNISITDLLINFLNKLGLGIVKKEKTPPKTKFSKNIKLLLSIKSPPFRKKVLEHLFDTSTNTTKKKTPQKFTKPTIRTSSQNNLNKLEIEILALTNWLLPIFFFYYIISVFFNQKISTFTSNTILYPIYSTKVIIYIVIATLFLHSSVRIKQLLSSKNAQIINLTYILFTVLYILILLNL